MATGVIRWFHEGHGYGFIDDSEQTSPLYVHHTDIEGHGYRSLRPGQRVHYEIQRDGRDVRAVEVKTD